MVVGVVWARKRYHAVKYVFVLMITVGVAVFMYQPAASSPADAAAAADLTDSHTFGFGEFLLVRYVSCPRL